MRRRHVAGSKPLGSAAACSDDSQVVLEARDVSVGYGGIPVVHALNLQVGAGQVTALLGPNGAGKSTTLLSLAGELSPYSGDIMMNGRIAKSPLHRRVRDGLAYVPEERSILRSMSCRDNLRLGLSDENLTLDLFPELIPRLKIGAGLLSGGEQQMLGLGRALSMKPRVLLVDELSMGLGPLIVRRLFEVLRSAADNGAAVLLVEQHVRQALAISDYAYVMRRGKVELHGPADALLARIDEIEAVYLSASISR
jgi:branched-chain amino acid transport system ATP-binding protein